VEQSERIPFDEARTLVNDEGTILVWIWEDGAAEAAVRPHRSATWGPVQALKDAP
jgi:hypothetical protein